MNRIKLTSKKAKEFTKILENMDPEEFGNCDFCPISTKMLKKIPLLIRDPSHHSCGYVCNRLLNYFGILKILPKDICDGAGGGVACNNFAEWFYNLKVVTRANTKI